jgi:hypothetical protein
MKTITILFVAMLAIAGSAFAQVDTSATTAAQGTYPAGSTYNGVPITALQIATGALISAVGTAEGHLEISLIGPTIPGVAQQVIAIDADPSGGSHAAANVATITGTCSIDMGTGTPALTGVPFVATITTDDQHLGSVGLVLGATSLPTATINDGSMTITDLTP